MKTNSPTPDYEELKALLANSFHSEEADDVPPLPDDLRERIRQQYGMAAEPAKAPARERSQSVFVWLTSLLARPAFQGAVAALVLLAVAAVLLVPRGEDFRGDTEYAGVRIVLVGFDAERAKEIAAAFDEKSVRIVDDLAGQLAADGRTIVLDGKDGEIEGYAGPDAEPLVRPLPDSPAAIASEVAKMSNDLKE